MLRLPAFTLQQPSSIAEAIGLLASAGPRAVVLAGGTDLLPNMKHELVTPEVVVALGGIPALRGITRADDGTIVIGAMTPLATVAAHAAVREAAPALAQAASLVAGPQLRAMGTIGGNVLLDTRCQYFNQSYFWRSALGFCLKKDGRECFVVEGGRRCVAAASSDSVPPLLTLDAVLEIEGPSGRREVRVEDFWIADGVCNRKLAPSELLVAIRVPPVPRGHRGAYGKLRERGAIDFPMLGVAARLDVDADDAVSRADLVVTVLAAQPKRVRQAQALLAGLRPGTSVFEDAARELADVAWRHCRTLPNVPGDPEWRRAMVPLYVRRTIDAAARGGGPVHHV